MPSGVVDEGEEQVLPDVAHGRPARAGARATMPRRSPLTSVTPALSIATSVPVPIAMPTSAAASAGASLMPSPAMATTRPFACAAVRRPAPCPPAAPRPRPRRCRACRATACAVVRLSPVSMTMRTPASRERVERRRRRRLDRVGDGDDAGELCRRRRRTSTVAPSRAQCVGLRLRARADVDAEPRIRSSRCRARRRGPSTVPRTPLPADASKSLDRRRSASLALRAPRTIARGQRMLAGALEARGQRAAARPRRTPSRRATATTFGLPSVSVPVLSTTSVSTFSQPLERLGVLDQHAGRAPRPTPTMIDIGVARPSAQGQAMISTATAFDQRVGEARLRARDRPDDEGERPQSPMTAGTNQPETCRPAAGSARGCAAPRATICTIRASSVSGRPSRRASRSAPVPLTVPPMTLSPALFSTGIGFAGHHRLVDARCALRAPSPSTGTFRRAARAADRRRATLSSGTSSSVPSRTKPARGLGREVEQRADRAAGLLARAQLQHLAEQHQHVIDRRRLEIDRRRRRRRRGTPAGTGPATTVATRL